jgi:uncharacterized membrane protein
MGELLGVRILLFVIMLGSGVVLVRVARATASGRLGRNHVAGIRVPSTLASDEAWLAAHVRAERPTVLAGYTSMATAVFALIPVPPAFLAGGVLLGCLAMIGCVLHGARAGTRSAVEVAERPAG